MSSNIVIENKGAVRFNAFDRTWEYRDASTEHAWMPCESIVASDYHAIRGYEHQPDYGRLPEVQRTRVQQRRH